MATFRYAKAYTLFDEILVRNARAGSTITFKCSGKGCPKTLKPRTITQDAAKLRIAKPLGKAKLKVGTRFEVRITRATSTSAPATRSAPTAPRPAEILKML